ncbi:MAG: 23S rRNA (uridine(2552)-2'-O)-methyltransferase RlmE [Betaproteobacteria bacterium]|nr:23S rRNA (uridine(2552)-2'-O)-methyltransferase RlmE [Betaproteobacteria bacterium]
MKKHKTSKAWMREHVTDPYVQRAKAEGWRSRAAFKLMEIDDKDRLLRPGMTVVDLGAAPGGWSQVAAQRVGREGRVLALDLLDMAPVPGVAFLQGDFREDSVLRELTFRLMGKPVDLVISDLAPNISGIAATDQARSEHLAELALEFARRQLKPGGDFLVKVFQGAGFDAFRAAMVEAFDKVVVRKPKSSRDRSNEVYLLGRGRRPLGD